MLFRILVYALLIAVASPSYAQTAVIPYWKQTTTSSSSIPVTTTTPLPIGVYGGSSASSGLCLTSNGPGVLATFQTCGGAGGVSSFNAGTTGLTPTSATTGAITLGGILNVANGGIGNSTGNLSALNATSVFGSTNQTLSQFLGQFYSVKDFGAKGDGTTDDTTAIQNAVNAAVNGNGGALFFPCSVANQFYKITSAINIPFGANFHIYGAAKGCSVISQATDNTNIFHFTGTLTNGFKIDELTFTWANPQPSTNTNAVAMYFDPGVAGTIFNFVLDHLVFGNGFRAISNNITTNDSLWGFHLTNTIYNGSMTGALLQVTPSPAVGDPNIDVDHIYANAADSTEPVINISSGDLVSLKNIEFNNGTGISLISISSTPNVLIDSVKAEVYAFGSANTILFNFPNSKVVAHNVSFNAFTGTANPILIAANSGGVISIDGLWATSSMTAGLAMSYEGSVINQVNNININGSFISKRPRDFGSLIMPLQASDNQTQDFTLQAGDASITIGSAAATGAGRYVVYNAPITAARTVSLGTTGLLDGQETTVVRTPAATGAFNVSVSDTVSGINSTLLPTTVGNNWVKYRATGTGSYTIVGASQPPSMTGIGTPTPDSNLTVIGSTHLQGHVAYNGTTAPAVSACGTSPSVDANATDNSGTITVGSGVVTSCTLTFAAAYTSFNHCNVTDHSSTSTIAYSYTLSAITVTGTSIPSILLDYRCDGK